MKAWLIDWLVWNATLGGGVLTMGCLVAWAYREPARRLRILHYTWALVLCAPTLMSLGLPWKFSISMAANESSLSIVDRVDGVVAPRGGDSSESFDPAALAPFPSASPFPSRSPSLSLSASASPSLSPSAPVALPRPELSWVDLYLFAHGTVAALTLAWWGIGTISLRRLWNQGAPIDMRSNGDVATFGRVGRVEARSHPRLASPCAFGLRRARILLPEKLTCPQASEDLDFALRHELAHFRHGDLRTWRLTRLAQALFWFLPHYWWARNQVRLCQDFLADEAASGADRRADFADFLVRVARGRFRRNPVSALPLIRRHSDLSRRVSRLIESNQPIELQCPKTMETIAKILTISALVVAATIRLNAADPADQSPTDNSSNLTKAEGSPDREVAVSKEAAVSAEAESAVTSPRPPRSESRTLRIHVGTDSFDSAPLVAATIQSFVPGSDLVDETKTDSDGNAAIEIPANGQGLIRIHKEGFLPLKIEPALGFDEDYRTWLSPAISLGGVVRTPSGLPLAGAQVGIQCVGNPSLRPPGEVSGPTDQAARTITTDSSGRWSYPYGQTPIRYLRLEVDHPMYAYYWEEFKPTRESRRRLEAFVEQSHDLTLKPGIPVSGVARDDAGRPLSEVEIRLASQESQSLWLGIATTDASGRYVRAVERPGPVTLIASKDGFVNQTLDIEITESRHQFDLALTRANAIRVRVQDEQGNPIGGASIRPIEWNLGALYLYGKTDAEGRYVNRQVGDQAIALRVSKSGYQDSGAFTVSAAESERLVTLKRQPRLELTVSDAVTGAPIAKFEVISGQTIPGALYTYWNPNTERRGRNGKLTMVAPLASGGGSQKLKVDAAGYRPALVELPREVPKILQLKVELSPSEPVQGKVILKGGSAVENALVLLVSGAELIDLNTDSFESFEERFSQRRLTYGRSDETGGFALDPGLDPQFVVAMTPEAVGFSPYTEDHKELQISIEPWGEIRGQASPPGISVSARFPYTRRPEMGPFAIRRSAISDDEGRFNIGFLPKGIYEVGRLPDTGDETHGMYQDETVDLAPGQTIRVALGTTGRSLVGVAQVLGQETDVDWTEGNHQLSLFVDYPDWLQDRPNRSDFNSDEAFDRSLEEHQARTRAFFESKAGQVLADRHRAYPVVLNPDGSFRIDGIPPGTYYLRINPTETVFSGNGLSSTQRTVGSIHKKIVIPESDGARDPMDIGIVEVALDPKLRVGDRAPEFSITDLSGEPLRLSDFRGKYVLLDFWATWCGPCIAELPELKEVYKKFGSDDRFVMIGMSLDDDPATAQRFCERQEMDWLQGFVGPWGTSDVLTDYGIHGIPDAYLIDPEGRIVAQGIRGALIYHTLRHHLK